MQRLADQLDLQMAVGQARLLRLRFFGAELRVDHVAVREDQRGAVGDVHDDSRADALPPNKPTILVLIKALARYCAGYRGDHVIERIRIGLELADADGEAAFGQGADDAVTTTMLPTVPNNPSTIPPAASHVPRRRDCWMLARARLPISTAAMPAIIPPSDRQTPPPDFSRLKGLTSPISKRRQQR